jgi:cysteine-rich repeat protein
MRKLTYILAILMFYITTPLWADTHYVRTDGGTGTQCTGLTDAAYTSGTACAVNHPNWVFPPRGESTTRQASAGDTVVIGSGSYKIGCQNETNCKDANVNLTDGAYCALSYSYDCYMGIVPNNTTVIGCSSSGCSINADRPELWGAGRISQILNLTNSSGVTLEDLLITDHAACGYGHRTLDCGTADAAELSASTGVRVTGSSSTTLNNLRISGLRSYGVYGGSVNTITFKDTEISYNAYGGWDTDSCSGAGTCGVTGTITFENTDIIYNGCIMKSTYGEIENRGCYSQDQTGYGDGIGCGNTAGNWVIYDSSFSHNISDGLDLLYMNNGTYSGGTVNIKRSLFEGNVGNQVKIPNASYIEDSIIIGNCGFFYGKDITCDFATCAANFNNCRAFGTPVVISYKSGDSTVPKIYNSTILSNGDIGLQAGGTCTTGTDFLVSNNILRGGWEFGQSDTSSIYYESSPSTCNPDFIESYNICYGWKEGASACNGTGSTDTVDPGFTGTISQGTGAYVGYYTTDNYAEQLYISSANGSSDETISGTDSIDYNSFSRGTAWDIGALEYGSVPSGGPNPICGDGNIDTASPYLEVCDGANLNSQTCQSQGFDLGGTLTCNATDCKTFVTTGCASSSCGNGVVEALEQCDDGNTTSGDGCSGTCQIETPQQLGFVLRGCSISGGTFK